jgi:hypothetical protein
MIMKIMITITTFTMMMIMQASDVLSDMLIEVLLLGPNVVIRNCELRFVAGLLTAFQNMWHVLQLHTHVQQQQQHLHRLHGHQQRVRMPLLRAVPAAHKHKHRVHNAIKCK